MTGLPDSAPAERASEDWVGVLSSASVVLDCSARTVRVRGALPLALARRPAQVLELLMHRSPLSVPLAEVDQHLGAGQAAVVDVKHHVLHLRALLELDRRRPRLIVTVRGVGYRFAEAVTAVAGAVVAPSADGGSAAVGAVPPASLAGGGLGPALLAQPPVALGELLLDPAGMSVRLRGHILPALPVRQFALLYALVGQAGRLLAWTELEDWLLRVSPSTGPARTGRAVREAVSLLGAWLGAAGAEGYLRVVKGEGVVLAAPQGAPEPARHRL